MRIQRPILLLTAITTGYLTMFAATFWVLMPLQQSLSSGFLPFAHVTSLITLTHGVRMIVTWLWRWQAVPLLLPGAAIEALVLQLHFNMPPSDYLLMTTAFATNSFIAFELARTLGWNEYACAGKRANWRALVLVGILASLINGALIAQMQLQGADPWLRLWLATNVLIGGTFGLILWLLMLRTLLRVALRSGLLSLWT
ncbi:MAG: hypothetical protein AB7S99_22565 [Pseudodonghicola sp.]